MGHTNYDPDWRKKERQAKLAEQKSWEANRQYCVCGHPIDGHSLGDFGPEKCFITGCECREWRLVKSASAKKEAESLT